MKLKYDIEINKKQGEQPELEAVKGMREYEKKAFINKKPLRLLAFLMALMYSFVLFAAPDVPAETHSETPWKEELDASPKGHITLDGYAYYELARQILPMVNELRAEVGVHPLKFNWQLEEMAMQRAAETSILWSHMRPNGEYVYESDIVYTGENIAAGNTDPAEVFQQWVDSEPHYEAMVSPRFYTFGIGAFGTSEGEPPRWWTQIFSESLGPTEMPAKEEVARYQPTVEVATDLLHLRAGKECKKGVIFDRSGFYFPVDFKEIIDEPLRLLPTTHYDTQDPYGVRSILQDEEVSWQSSDESILSIDDQGYCEKHAMGEVTVTCRMKRYPEIESKVQVQILPVKSFAVEAELDVESADRIAEMAKEYAVLSYREAYSEYQRAKELREQGYIITENGYELPRETGVDEDIADNEDKAGDIEGQDLEDEAGDEDPGEENENQEIYVPEEPQEPVLNWDSVLENYLFETLKLLSMGEPTKAPIIFPDMTKVDADTLIPGYNYSWHIFSSADDPIEKIPNIPLSTKSFATLVFRFRDSTYTMLMYSDKPADGKRLFTESEKHKFKVRVFSDMDEYKLEFPGGKSELTVDDSYERYNDYELYADFIDELNNPESEEDLESIRESLVAEKYKRMREAFEEEKAEEEPEASEDQDDYDAQEDETGEDSGAFNDENAQDDQYDESAVPTDGVVDHKEDDAAGQPEGAEHFADVLEELLSQAGEFEEGEELSEAEIEKYSSIIEEGEVSRDIVDYFEKGEMMMYHPSIIDKPKVQKLDEFTYDFTPYIVKKDEKVQPHSDPDPAYLKLSSDNEEIAEFIDGGILKVHKNGMVTLRAEYLDASDPDSVLKQSELRLKVDLAAFRPLEEEHDEQGGQSVERAEEILPSSADEAIYDSDKDIDELPKVSRKEKISKILLIAAVIIVIIGALVMYVIMFRKPRDKGGPKGPNDLPPISGSSSRHISSDSPDDGYGPDAYASRPVTQNAAAAPQLKRVAPGANRAVVPPANRAAEPIANRAAVPPANRAVIPPANRVPEPPANRAVIPPANRAAEHYINHAPVPSVNRVPAASVNSAPASTVSTESQWSQASRRTAVQRPTAAPMQRPVAPAAPAQRHDEPAASMQRTFAPAPPAQRHDEPAAAMQRPFAPAPAVRPGVPVKPAAASAPAAEKSTGLQEQRAQLRPRAPQTGISGEDRQQSFPHAPGRIQPKPPTAGGMPKQRGSEEK